MARLALHQRAQSVRRGWIRWLDPFWYRVAALVILAFVVAAAWWGLAAKKQHHIPRIYRELAAGAGRAGGAGTVSLDKRQIIHLPDSSTVILNEDSKLDYPAAFAGNSRDVYLNGEGYFDIVHNPGKPFLVHTGKIVTEVLGTTFDIMAYPADGVIQVTVMQGRVRVLNGDKELGLLTDNQQISFDAGTEQYQLQQVDTSTVSARKPEEVGFDGTTMQEAATTIGQLYKILVGFFVDGKRYKASKGRAYYLHAGGNDGNKGGRNDPWKTMDRLAGLQLHPGDSLLFAGGQTFTGTLLVGPGSGGDPLNPLLIGSYGQGSATIHGGDSSAVILYQSDYCKVRSLQLTGNGRKNGNVKDGLSLIECHHVFVDSLDISGFQKSGLFLYSSSAVSIRHVYAHDNGAAGIAVEGADGKRSSLDIRIMDCRAENNPGDPTNLTNHSGNGIVAGHCTNLHIEHCTATNNGWDMPRIGNGPVGIWCYEADSVTIQHCLSYRNKTSVGGADGGGFDLDGGVTNSVIQYCLSYGNQGSGYCIFQYWGASPWYNNVIRYNISEDDGLVSDSRGGLYVWNSSGDEGQFHDCLVYNNTIYNSREAALSYSEKSARKSFFFYNNIFVGKDSLIRGEKGADVFGGNDWWLLRPGKGLWPGDSASGTGAPVPGAGGDQRRDVFLNPSFRKPGNTRMESAQGLEGFKRYRIPARSLLRSRGMDLRHVAGERIAGGPGVKVGGGSGVKVGGGSAGGSRDFNGRPAPARGIGASF